jgi:hypothetical protein
VFQLIPKLIDGVKVRALCRPVKFFHTNLGKPFLLGTPFVHGGIVMLKQERASYRMSLYAVALKFPFTGTKGPIPNHDKQPQAIRYSSSKH